MLLDFVGFFSRRILFVLQPQGVEVLLNFVVRLYLLLEVSLYFSNLL